MGVGNRLRTMAYRVHDDNGLPSVDGNWINPENTAWFQLPGKTFRLRMNVLRNGDTPLTTRFRLVYYKNSGGGVRVRTDTSNVRVVETIHYVHDDDCLDLHLDGGVGTILETPNGMYVDAGNDTGDGAFPGANRRVETEWSLQLVPGDNVPGDIFEFELKRAGGAAFQLAAVHTPTLVVTAGGAVEGAGRLGKTVNGAGIVRSTVSGRGNLSAAVLGAGGLESVVQGAGYFGPSVKGAGAFRPEDS